jgi:hypothetical protein
MNADIYYDRNIRSWVVIFRDQNGNGIVNPRTGEEASYFYSKAEAKAFASSAVAA